MRAFHCEQIPAPGEYASMPQCEFKHIFKVLRASPGDQIILLDGKGATALAKIADGVAVMVESVENHLRHAPKISLFVSPPRHSGMDDIIASACETAVSGIFPMICEHSVAFPRKADKWRRCAIESCKQARNPFFPIIHEPLDFKDAVAVAKDSDAFYGDPHQGDPCAPQFKTDIVSWFVGPEGGFSDDEKKTMETAGFKPLKLSPVIMRVETAALAGIVMLSHCQLPWSRG
jgi:16S rRNA (uracil1498-N3)-methyltransferase